MNAENNNEDIKILSLNGGGVRGLFSISLLAKIEEILEDKYSLTDVRIGEYFDLITGTSIGGILALGLASGKSARELLTAFEENAPKIFPAWRFRFKKTLTLFRPIYRSEPLYDTIKSMIGEDIRFKDLDRRVIIPAVNLSNGRPKFFKTAHNPDFNLDDNIRLIDAAMATSAAPTYFKPHFCADLKSYFADGGLVSNNPSFAGLKEVLIDMKTDFASAKISNIRILNIGTLSEEYCIGPKVLKKKQNKGYFGLWGMGERLVLSTMTANQHLQRFMLKRELESHNAKDNFVELDDIIPNEASMDITLDNAAISSLDDLIRRGNSFASESLSKDTKVQNFFINKAKPFVRKPSTLGDKS